MQQFYHTKAFWAFPCFYKRHQPLFNPACLYCTHVKMLELRWAGQHGQCCQQCCSAMLTMLLQHYSVSCNNLLTSWNRHVMIVLSIQFSLFSTAMNNLNCCLIIDQRYFWNNAEQYCWNIAEQYFWNNAEQYFWNNAEQYCWNIAEQCCWNIAEQCCWNIAEQYCWSNNASHAW